MKYILTKNLLTDLQVKLQAWMKNIYYEKYYKNTKKWIYKYIRLCNDFYLDKNINLKKLINRHFHGSKSSFYLWSKKIINGYRNNNFHDLRYKSTRPKNIKYHFPQEIRKEICDYYFNYKMVKAGGVLSLYHNVKTNMHKINASKTPKNVMTFYRWIRQDPRYKIIRKEMKKARRYFKRYEVSELGLLQLDAKVFTKKNFPIKNDKLYVYDFIDEKTRIAFGYVYDSLGVGNAINAVNRAIKDFKALGIKIKRIRTDNALEFTNVMNVWKRKKNPAKAVIQERPFEQFLKQNNITHELTPIRSPQSNGKIERFHQNYRKLFLFNNRDIKLSEIELQNYLNQWYKFYNFERKHKSLNFKTPFCALKQFM